MSDVRTALAVCLLVLVAVALPVAVSSIGTAGTTSISAGESPTADPDGTITAAPGENVTVVIWANATNVTAYQANVTFNPDIVQVAAVSGSSDFKDPVANANGSAGGDHLHGGRRDERDQQRLVRRVGRDVRYRRR